MCKCLALNLVPPLKGSALNKHACILVPKQLNGTYRIEGNIGGLQLWRILCKSMFDEINFGEFEAPVKYNGDNFRDNLEFPYTDTYVVSNLVTEHSVSRALCLPIVFQLNLAVVIPGTPSTAFETSSLADLMDRIQNDVRK